MLNRQTILKKLKEGLFDLLIIGGGATGSGIALDAAARGLSVALVEKQDFSSGASSKSTKLLHGGVRYLEQALKTWDFSLLRLVSEGLKERKTLLRLAPHLARPIPIVIPVYSWCLKLYYGLGMKLYEALAGHYSVGKTSFLSKAEVKELFPNLLSDGLKGGVQFFDGQFDDARMNLSIILTAIQQGATALNYLEVIKFEKQEERVVAALVKDHRTGEEFLIRAKKFVNAAGPFSDSVRILDDKKSVPMIAASSGTHLVLDGHYVQKGKGLLIPRTNDGRVLFVLPWKGATLVGTTDGSTSVCFDPKPKESEIAYLLDHLNHHLSANLKREDIRACWTGIRPLIAHEGKSTANLSRDFKITQSHSGVYSIIGGKWTSYRRMAESLVNELFDGGDFGEMRPCVTEKISICGGERSPKDIARQLREEIQIEKGISEYLSKAYGTRAFEVFKVCKENNQHERLTEKYPFLKGEISYAFQYEMACTLEDVLYRRLSLGLLDEKAAQEICESRIRTS